MMPKPPQSKLSNVEDSNVEDDEILVIEEDEESTLQETSLARTGTLEESASQNPWQVLVVDDDPSVYQSTQLALKDFNFLGKPLAFLYADSGTEAKKLLNKHPGICFVLLDVVMETNDAGLQVVRYIRDTLNNQRMQIILRTGQPGEAPETSLIQEYEINDYKLKTELTRQRLITTVTTSLRAYCNIVEAEEKTEKLAQALALLQQTQLQLVKSEKMSALGNLVAGIAHEINNPIGCIVGNVDVAQNYFNDLLRLLDLYAKQFPNPGPDIENELETVELAYVRDDLPQLIRAMKDGGERIINISRSLRTFSRADTETRQAFDLHKGLESTILILRHRLNANDQRPAIEIVKEYGDIPEIVCFPGQLNQVFMNILSNAIEALDEAHQTLSFTDRKAYSPRITIRTEVDNHHLLLAIVDNGPGIPEAIKDKVFDHLFTTKDVGKGTGLGLAIARQIVVDSHRGSLDVQSDMGQGTKFCIQLPL